MVQYSVVQYSTVQYSTGFYIYVCHKRLNFTASLAAIKNLSKLTSFSGKTIISMRIKRKGTPLILSHTSVRFILGNEFSGNSMNM